MGGHIPNSNSKPFSSGGWLGIGQPGQELVFCTKRSAMMVVCYLRVFFTKRPGLLEGVFHQETRLTLEGVFHPGLLEGVFAFKVVYLWMYNCLNGRGYKNSYPPSLSLSLSLSLSEIHHTDF
jgi:hypothetical protein